MSVIIGSFRTAASNPDFSGVTSAFYEKPTIQTELRSGSDLYTYVGQLIGWNGSLRRTQ